MTEDQEKELLATLKSIAHSLEHLTLIARTAVHQQWQIDVNPPQQAKRSRI